MAASQTLLCIYRDPGQLNLLREEGYELITTSNGRDGLRLVMSRSVDGIVLEGLLNGAGVADEIKRVRPRLPIVMIAENLELPDGALRSVDGLVTKSDGPQFSLATVGSVLRTKQGSQPDSTSAEQAMPPHSQTGESDGNHRRSSSS
jgi:DNA-binding response OmpR family regulator